MDDSEKGLCIGRFDFTLLPIGGDHFNWGTVCPPVGTQLGIALSEFFDVILHVDGVGQRGNYIGDGEVPFFLVCDPGVADLFFFERREGGHDGFRVESWQEVGNEECGFVIS